MDRSLHVYPLGRIARIANVLMVPLMYILSGTFKEKPQQTHRWTNCKFGLERVKHLDRQIMASFLGRKGIRLWKPLIMHMPIFGGPRHFVVLKPEMDGSEEWHIGWILPNRAAVSRILLRGPVRMLWGPEDVLFYAINAKTHIQVPLCIIGEGKVGDNSDYARCFPLL